MVYVFNNPLKKSFHFITGRLEKDYFHIYVTPIANFVIGVAHYLVGPGYGREAEVTNAGNHAGLAVHAA